MEAILLILAIWSRSSLGPKIYMVLINASVTLNANPLVAPYSCFVFYADILTCLLGYKALMVIEDLGLVT